jgi:hypothetical protein
MSKVKIQGNSSGTGVFTIEAPNSNTDRTLTLPDNAGEVLTNASDIPAANLTGSLPAIDGSSLTGVGKVLNVWQATKTDTQAISGFTAVDVSGLTLTINPTSTSSKFLVTFNVWASNDYYKSYINLLRNGTVLSANADGAGDGRYRGTSVHALDQGDINSHGLVGNHTITYLDSPNTTSSLTYKIQARGRLTSNVTYINRSVPDRTVTEYDDRLVSHIIVTEIAS